jgi:hypothetical protein
MNVYHELYKRANKAGKVSYKKLQELQFITGIDLYYLYEIRKIFHLMTDLQIRHKPMNKRADISEKGNYVDMEGNLHATDFRRSINWNTWSDTVPTLYYAERTGKTSKTYKWEQYKDIFEFFQDRRVNVIWINQYSIPKYCSKTRSLSMDKSNAHTEVIQPLVKDKFLVLRAEYAGENEYEIVVISRKYQIKYFHATVTGKIIGLGKSKAGSKRSSNHKVVKATTAALSD